jgi:purine-nucleoside phosphorylase
MAREIDVTCSIDYRDIPGFPLATVESHAGKLLLGTIGARRVIAMQGRFHRYEGYTLRQVTFPVRVLRAVGAHSLIVSNACGCMNPAWNTGELMAIADHINLLGENPLVGRHDPSEGVRFPDMSEPYDSRLRALASEEARKLSITLREGVYIAVTGPSLETRAEYRALRMLGADVVGMSTVPEVIVAVQCGLRVLGISLITDMGIPETLLPASIENVLAVAARSEPDLTRLMTAVVCRL